MATTREEKERGEFEAQMARNTARLLDFAKPYIGRLTTTDRDAFLELAIEQAWRQRATFAPTEASLLMWWGGCLRAVADSRRYWDVIYYDNSVRAIESKRLGNGAL